MCLHQQKRRRLPACDFISRDRISDFPDEILIRILSFLDTHQAIKTSILSRRWRYLWRYTPVLSLDNSNYETHDDTDKFLKFVRRSLELHRASRIDTLSVSYDYRSTKYWDRWQVYYKDDSSEVDSWIHHAVQHNARELNINLWTSEKFISGKLYELPPCLFDFASLEVLNLKGVRLHPPPSSKLISLRTVILKNVMMGQDAIKNLTSASTCLESLALHGCSGLTSDGKFGTLNVHSSSTKLESIFMGNANFWGDGCTLYAPNIRHLTLRRLSLRGSFQIIQGLPLLKSLVLDFEELYRKEKFGKWLLWGEYKEADGDRLIELLHSLRHVVKLELCSWCVQVLARRAMSNGANCLSTLKVNAKSLKLKTSLNKWELPGIVCLLNSCYQLQAIDIEFGTHKGYTLNSGITGKYDFKDSQYWKDLESNSPYVIERLSTVRISGFMDEALMLAKESNAAQEEILQSVMHQVHFIRFLLKSSVALDKIVIGAIKESDISHRMEIPDSLVKLVEELVSCPKASPKAKMVIHRN